MTVAEAIGVLREIGTVEAEAGGLKLRIPQRAASTLKPVLDTLTKNKGEALALLTQTQPTPTLELTLAGKAVELYSDLRGERFWIVADERDAGILMQRERVGRGAIYTAPEVRLVIRMNDPDTVQMVDQWKRETDGIVRSVNRRA